MATQRRLLTLKQVPQTKRHSWTENDGRKYYYDGISFWVTTLDLTLGASFLSVPEDGWWHREGCNCPLCRVDG